MKRLLLALALAACARPKPEMTRVDGERCFPAGGVYWVDAWPYDGVSAYDIAWTQGLKPPDWEWSRQRDFGGALGSSFQAFTSVAVDGWPPNFLCIRGRALVVRMDE